MCHEISEILDTISQQGNFKFEYIINSQYTIEDTRVVDLIA
jgi:hypothetical protein